MWNLSILWRLPEKESDTSTFFIITWTDTFNINTFDIIRDHINKRIVVVVVVVIIIIVIIIIISQTNWNGIKGFSRNTN